jgi:endonuclease YncB( thermonuclease family)
MKTLLAAVALAALALPLTPAVARAPDELPLKCRDKPVPAPFAAEAYAMDGDTVALVGVDYTVRIWGIQAAELRAGDKQESMPGMRGRAELADALAEAGQKVQVAPTKWDRYCRAVAVLTVAPAKLGEASTVDVGLVMLSRGVAYGFWLDDAVKDQAALSVSYAAAEAKARKARLGLWRQWLGEK